jgi:hypothetical protein
MATKLLMIHGRNQASEDRIAADPAMLDAYIGSKRREFVAGLAKGLVLSGLDPIADSAVIFPFYGNEFSERIRRFTAAGGQAPVLETAFPGAVGANGRGKEVQKLAKLQADLLKDMAATLDYDPNMELEHLGQDAGFPRAEALGPDDLLRIPFLTGALQFLSRKTGAPAEIIRTHLTDVAYYLGRDDMRTMVLDIVRKEVIAKSSPGDDLIVIGHSLGSVVAYDFLASTDDDTVRKRNISLLVTAGSPLGFAVVKKHLISKTRRKNPKVPELIPARSGGWINAYDVTDVVALIHPLSPEFDQPQAGQIRDERTHNPTDPHAIIDYLADPDVAGPIGRAFNTG